MKQIIVVNGVSSSGRTSLVTQFCLMTGTEYRKTHIDEFIKTLSPHEWEKWAGTDTGWSEIGKRYNHYLADLSHSFEKIIADAFYILPTAREHLFSLFGRRHVFYVQLFCELHELERREVARGDRPIGLARSQFDTLYSFADYDLKIDSTEKSIKTCAEELLNEQSSRFTKTG